MYECYDWKKMDQRPIYKEILGLVWNRKFFFQVNCVLILEEAKQSPITYTNNPLFYCPFPTQACPKFIGLWEDFSFITLLFAPWKPPGLWSIRDAENNQSRFLGHFLHGSPNFPILLYNVIQSNYLDISQKKRKAG